jgi:ATP synthase protein I
MQYEQDGAGEAGEEVFQRLSAEDVKVLRQRGGQSSPWFVIWLQIFVGFFVAGVAWFFTGLPAVGWSVAYGALAVVVPAVVFVRGLVRQQWASSAGSALGGFFLWEAVKVLLTVVMLFAAPRLVVGLSWLALLVGFVVTMKVYWLAVWMQSVRQKSVPKI